MKIALDFDETVTRDEPFWTEFCQLARKYGHSVTIVTIRHKRQNNDDIAAFAFDAGIREIVCTAGLQKSTCFEADIWVDDMPLLIPSYDAMKGVMLGCEKLGG